MRYAVRQIRLTPPADEACQGPSTSLRCALPDSPPHMRLLSFFCCVPSPFDDSLCSLSADPSLFSVRPPLAPRCSFLLWEHASLVAPARRLQRCVGSRSLARLPYALSPSTRPVSAPTRTGPLRLRPPRPRVTQTGCRTCRWDAGAVVVRRY
ncbi:hypothetical protein OH76DRAFT_122722 [Lentinus brumalis]|uniref:Uncharacterized protein n=1 Tax=Lentinus brumalis TaxID=2498619 RepID=A0A371DJM3_9APHY|nr:hypothetical protein OH76DRAFT_122722 [Polyporus brumalis]